MKRLITMSFIFVYLYIGDQSINQSINQLSRCLISVSTDSKAHHPIRKAMLCIVTFQLHNLYFCVDDLCTFLFIGRA